MFDGHPPLPTMLTLRRSLARAFWGCNGRRFGGTGATGTGAHQAGRALGASRAIVMPRRTEAAGGLVTWQGIGNCEGDSCLKLFYALVVDRCICTCFWCAKSGPEPPFKVWNLVHFGLL